MRNLTLLNKHGAQYPPCPKQKIYLVVVHFRTLLFYVFGGWDGNSALDIIDRYSLNENNWDTLEIKLPLPVEYC